MNHIEQENLAVEAHFDLYEVMAFTFKHDVQIIRGPDFQYLAQIDGKHYGTSLTPLHALWYGIKAWKLKNLVV